jgi:hypothetical protein
LLVLNIFIAHNSGSFYPSNQHGCRNYLHPEIYEY